MTLALALGRAGFETRLIEPDRETRERIEHVLRKSGCGDSVRVVAQADLADAKVLIADEGQMPGLSDGWVTFFTDVTAIPESGIALNPVAPLHLRDLIEVCPGKRAPGAAIDTAICFVTAMGRRPLLVVRGGGSALARLWRALERGAESLLLEGADPFEVDEALRARGWDTGMFEAEDLIGLDRGYAARRAENAPRCLVHDRMVEEGRLGAQAGVGWYRYPGGGGPVIDPLIEDLIREEAHFAKIAPVARSMEDIVASLMQVLRQAGAALISEGVLRDEDDLALAISDGLGLPASLWR
jgi:3-hydroxyacyl-CoA dehydrogenase